MDAKLSKELVSYSEINRDFFTETASYDLIAHGCTGQGVWGVGFAEALAKREPAAAVEFRQYCAQLKYGSILRGQCPIIQGRDALIACPITSLYYGPRIDPPWLILESTRHALLKLNLELERRFPKGTLVRIVSPMINSGDHKAPWERTRAEIQRFVETSPHVIQWRAYFQRHQKK